MIKKTLAIVALSVIPLGATIARVFLIMFSASIRFSV